MNVLDLTWFLNFTSDSVNRPQVGIHHWPQSAEQFPIRPVEMPMAKERSFPTPRRGRRRPRLWVINSWCSRWQFAGWHRASKSWGREVGDMLGFVWICAILVLAQRCTLDIKLSLINLGFDGYLEQSASNSDSHCRFCQYDQCNQGQVHLLSLMCTGELITAGSQDAVKATADQLCLHPVNNGLVSGQVCQWPKKIVGWVEILNARSPSKVSMEIQWKYSNYMETTWTKKNKMVPQKNQQAMMTSSDVRLTGQRGLLIPNISKNG